RQDFQFLASKTIVPVLEGHAHRSIVTTQLETALGICGDGFGQAGQTLRRTIELKQRPIPVFHALAPYSDKVQLDVRSCLTLQIDETTMKNALARKSDLGNGVSEVRIDLPPAESLTGCAGNDKQGPVALLRSLRQGQAKMTFPVRFALVQCFAGSHF